MVCKAQVGVGLKASPSCRFSVSEYLECGLPGLALHGLQAVQQLHKEAPASSRNVAIYQSQEAAEHVHLHIILVHAGTGDQPSYRPCKVHMRYIRPSHLVCMQRHVGAELNGIPDAAERDQGCFRHYEGPASAFCLLLAELLCRSWCL